ncbi:MAG: hypothetical protein IT454_16390 [Planctomycetes bacterium]|nr:hypothetical protein [Planctomycetota bacterium]
MEQPVRTAPPRDIASLSMIDDEEDRLLGLLFRSERFQYATSEAQETEMAATLDAWERDRGRAHVVARLTNWARQPPLDRPQFNTPSTRNPFPMGIAELAHMCAWPELVPLLDELERHAQSKLEREYLRRARDICAS